MWDSIFLELKQFATLQIFGILFVLFIFCLLGFEWRRKAIGEQIVLFDGRFWYTPDQAQELLKEMGSRGRQIYAFTQLTLDILFPFVYGLLIIILFFTYYDNPKYLLLMPVITVLADLLENITTAFLALSYKGLASPVTWIASAFTKVKLIGLCLSFFIILAGVLIFICHYFK